MNSKSILIVVMCMVAMLPILMGNTDGKSVEKTMVINYQENDSMDLAYIRRNIKPKQNIQYSMSEFRIQPLTDEIKKKIDNVSWKSSVPYKINDLVHVKVLYWGFDETTHKGELIVHKIVALDVMEIFQELYQAKFPIDKIKLIDEYQAVDDLSMEDNNTSALCVREVTNKKGEFSRHAFGTAIDINPIQNPYITSGFIVPNEGKEYINRSDVRKGMIIEEDICYNAFIKRGWEWGGHWSKIKDYQHFQKNVDIEVTEYPDITKSEFNKLFIEACQAIKRINNPQGEMIKIQNQIHKTYPKTHNKREKIEPYLTYFFTNEYVSEMIESLDIMKEGDTLIFPKEKKATYWANDEIKNIQILNHSKDKKNKTFKIKLTNKEIIVEARYIGSQGWRIHKIN